MNASPSKAANALSTNALAANALSANASTAPLYFIRTFGCQMNEHDSEAIAGLLETDGMSPASALEEADVIVLNTCCIRENADNKLYAQLGNLKALKEQKPNMQIAVAGCLAQKDREAIRQRAPHVDVVFGTHNVGRASELLAQARLVGPITEIVEESEEFPSALPIRRDSQHAAWLTIQIGCNNSCAFCIVPAVRGHEISRPFGELVAEVEALALEGVTEVTLLGQNVNSYGRDITLGLREASIRDEGLRQGSALSTADIARSAGTRWANGRRRSRPLFADLLRELGEVDGIERLRYISPHPKDLRPETIAAMAEVPAVCEHLHLPLQSGSNAVLAAMHRGYTAERFLDKARQARAAVPDLALSTDIIVGFPDETESDFQQTLEVATEVGFDSAFTFVFSPRPGTEAAEMADRFVDADVVKERMERLRVVVQRSALASNERRVGRREEVVVEGRSKTDPNKLSGRTRQNRLVHFAVPAGSALSSGSAGAASSSTENLRPGTYALVDVTAASAFYLQGELVEVTRPATHRTRIPVVAA